MENPSETVRCFSLVLLSLLLLPISLFAACLGLLLQHGGLAQAVAQDGSKRKTILVTGVGMAKGLTLARAFHRAGHRVVGADFEATQIPCSGRFSRSLSRFFRLPKPSQSTGAANYIQRLVDIIRTERVDLWVSCSGVASAVEDAQAKETIEQDTGCKCVQFDVPTTSMLHEKDSFMRETKARSLPVPETHDVESADDVLRILSDCSASDPERRFILKPVGMDDANRGDMTLLPLSSEVKTKDHVGPLPISPSNPWILQQFIAGGEEYCTHALVVRGQVKCFLACPSAELLMHYEALPRDSALWRAMLDFTINFVGRSPNPEAITGHLSFDFMVDEGKICGTGIERGMYAIECNPRAHTAVALFGQDGPELQAMVRAYLSAVDHDRDGISEAQAKSRQVNGTEEPLVMPPVDTTPRYWLGHDLVALLLHPGMELVSGHVSFTNFLGSALTVLRHMLIWKEGTFDSYDPLPALVLYHVYWPLTILSAWWNDRRWSRLNVSTTKMFMC
ncbi:carbamoylphosphate synthase large subunit [Xylariomycetidae sp. FL2044]|nr:carbamoylphosphate synthase large subunit [Xylariomycetidae sp. FL2044]